MLTVLLTVDTPANDFSERYKDFLDTILKYENDFEVIFLTKTDYPFKDAFRVLASKLPNHQFVALDELNNKNEVILTGLAQAQGDDILLCTWDTNIIVIDQLLQKRKEGCDLVFVKNKKSKFKKFFEGLGTASYNFGTRFIKHNFDMFAETDVQLIDGRVANLICAAPDESFELRVTNNYKQLKQGVVESEHIFENGRTAQITSPVFPLGVVAFFYLIGLVSLIIITPLFNQGIYSWWALLVIALWLVLGVVGLISTTKRIYRTRNANPVRLNRNGEPILIVQEFIENGESQIDYEKTDFEKQVDDLFVKEEAVSPASLIRRSTDVKAESKKQVKKEKSTKKQPAKTKKEKTQKGVKTKESKSPATKKTEKKVTKTSKEKANKNAAKSNTKSAAKTAQPKKVVSDKKEKKTTNRVDKNKKSPVQKSEKKTKEKPKTVKKAADKKPKVATKKTTKTK